MSMKARGICMDKRILKSILLIAAMFFVGYLLSKI